MKYDETITLLPEKYYYEDGSEREFYFVLVNAPETRPRHPYPEHCIGIINPTRSGKKYTFDWHNKRIHSIMEDDWVCSDEKLYRTPELALEAMLKHMKIYKKKHPKTVSQLKWYRKKHLKPIKKKETTV